MVPRSSARGFSIIEALVATFLVSSAIGGLAHLASLGVAQGNRARHATAALALAQSQLEVLRSARWTYDNDGARLSSPVLGLSPPGALINDYPGYADTVDAFGEAASRARAAYRRRWAVSRLVPADEDTLILQSCAFAVSHAPTAGSGTPDACVVTIRTRKP